MQDKTTVGYVHVDGQLLPNDGRHISALDRGFALSDGVFETIPVVEGVPFRLGAHLARLRASAAVLALPVPSPDDELAEAIARLLTANDLSAAVVRLTVSRGVPHERGLLPPAVPKPTIVIQAAPHRDLPPEKLARGLSAHICTVRRNEHSPTARIKACSYLDNVLARMEAQRAGADEAIMLNTAGALACCSAANLHLVIDGAVLTPALECGVLAGVTRRAVQELCGQFGIQWHERWLYPPDISHAQECFLTNSVLGVVPVTPVDARPVGTGNPGPITILLREQYRTLTGTS